MTSTLNLKDVLDEVIKFRYNPPKRLLNNIMHDCFRVFEQDQLDNYRTIFKDFHMFQHFFHVLDVHMKSLTKSKHRRRLYRHRIMLFMKRANKQSTWLEFTIRSTSDMSSGDESESDTVDMDDSDEDTDSLNGLTDEEL